MQARDRHHVRKADLREVARVLFVEIFLVAQQQRPQKCALALAVAALNGLTERPCDALRQILERARVCVVISRVAALIKQDVNALGREVAQMQPLPRRVGRAVEQHLRRHVRAGRKVQKVAVTVVDGPPRQAAVQDLHRDLRAVARLLGIAQKLDLDRVLRAEQCVVRRFDEVRIERVVPKREGKPQRAQKCALRPISAFACAAAESHDERSGGKSAAQNERPLRAQQILRERDAGRERRAENRQYPHRRAGSSVSPSR